MDRVWVCPSCHTKLLLQEGTEEDPIRCGKCGHREAGIIREVTDMVGLTCPECSGAKKKSQNTCDSCHEWAFPEFPDARWQCVSCGHVFHLPSDAVANCCILCFGEVKRDQALPDSGERRDFASGAVRDMAKGKGRFDLISPIALKRLAQHYEHGAIKYSERNWEKGIPLHSFFDSSIRHMAAYLEGDRSEDHLAAAAWNVFALIHTEEMVARGNLPKELADLPLFKVLPDV